MYEDNRDFKMRINWKDIIIKIVLVILFILLLIWLFPKADLDVFYDSVYINNVNTMKEAAKSYYTKDRLPKNVGEFTSMTLKQMIDNKMLIRFTDKDKNYCDETSSKVEVTKTAEDKYVLKVQLHCGEQKDYILETIGCNDVCTGSNCVATVIPGDTTNKDDNTDNKFDTEIPNDTSDPKYDNILSVAYYQHRKAIYTTKTELFCFDDGYTLDGNKCKKLTDIVIDATLVDKKDQYTCPEGYTQNGAYCFKYAQPTTASEQYTCPTGYAPRGNKCIQTYDATYKTDTTYTCPNGGNLVNTQCIISITGTPNTQTICPSGYTPNGSSCYAYVPAEQSSKTVCPDGYDPSGSKCVKTEDGTPKVSYGDWVNKGTKYYTQGNKAYTKDKEKLVYVGAVSGSVCGDPCNNTGIWYKYIYYTRSTKTTYECPSKEYTGGGTSSKCTLTIDGSTDYDYNCPIGDKEGTQCRITAQPFSSTTYICPTGYNGGGSSSLCTYTYNAYAYNHNGGYYCPNGGDVNGTQCIISVTGTPSTQPICPSGYNYNGTSCELKVDATKKENLTYTCPDSSYTLSGSKCIKKSSEEINANTSTTTSVSYQYQWSTSSSIDGWEFTGKTKTETKYTGSQK